MDDVELFNATGKAIISLVPGIGGAITSFMSDVQAARKEERYREFIECLNKDIQRVKDKLRREYISKIELADMFETTAKYVINEWSEQRRQAYKNILVNSMIFDNVSYDKTEEYLRLVKDLSELEILLISIFNKPIIFLEQNGIDINKRPHMNEKYSDYVAKLNCDLKTQDVYIITKILEPILNLTTEQITNSILSLGDRRIIVNSSENISNIDYLYSRLINKLTFRGKDFVSFIINPE